MDWRSFLIAAAGAALAHSASASAPTLVEQSLMVHNRERAAVGLSPLKWDEGLARKAERWAEQISRRGVLEHEQGSGASGQGENLWMGSRGHYSVAEMVGSWAEEKVKFKRGRLPNIHVGGDWSEVGHYSQMVWRDTSAVGCAIARSGEWDVLVCRYDPAGNRWGQAPF